VASACFVALSAGRTGLTLYLPALAYSEITGASIMPAIIVMGLITLAYTVWGGIEAVIWTDAVQVFVFTLGAVLSVAYILWGVHAAHADFFGIADQFHKFRVWEPSLDFRKLTSLWLILQTLFETIRIYGTQQDMTQRYATTSSTKEARKSVWISILGYIPLGFAFYFIGAALFVYYQAHQDPYIVGELAKAKPKFDAAYPHFIATQLPVGIKGIVLAAIFAAAMSTMSSLMNSGATVCVEDFYKRFWPRKRSDRHYLGFARVLTVLIGLAAIGVALYCSQVGQTAQLMWTRIMSYTTAGVLALMALAFLPIRIRPAAAIVGWLTAVGLVWYLSTYQVTHPLLFPVIGNAAGFVVALLLNTALVGIAGRNPFGPEERFPLDATPAAAAEAAPEPGDEEGTGP
jgi:Na+/proline symporter